MSCSKDLDGVVNTVTGACLCDMLRTGHSQIGLTNQRGSGPTADYYLGKSDRKIWISSHNWLGCQKRQKWDYVADKDVAGLHACRKYVVKMVPDFMIIFQTRMGTVSQMAKYLYR